MFAFLLLFSYLNSLYVLIFFFQDTPRVQFYLHHTRTGILLSVNETDTEIKNLAHGLVRGLSG